MRLLHDSSKRTDVKGLVREAVEGLEKFSEDSEKYFLNVLWGLIQSDIEKANSVKEIERGTLPFLATEAYQSNEDVIETPPIARTGHFAYALLDLIDQVIRSSYFSAFGTNELIKISSYIIRVSSQGFIRRKALELLYKIGTLDTVGMSTVEKSLESGAKEGVGSLNFKKAIGKWRHLKRRGQEYAAFHGQLQSIVVDCPRPNYEVWLSSIPLTSRVAPFS